MNSARHDEWTPSKPVVCAIYLLGALILGYPVLFGRFLAAPSSDQYLAGFAFREFAASSVKAGHGIPMWNPYLFGGMPYVAAMHGDIFYPTALLRLVLPVDIAMGAGLVLHLFLAGLFTHLLLRALRLSPIASLIGGIAYMLGGPIASFAGAGHDGKLFVSAMLPLILWCLVYGVRDGARWAWGALALVVGLMVLTPHPQLSQYALLLAGSFTLFLGASVHAHEKRAWSVVGRRIGSAFAAVALGITIGAVQYLPVFEYVRWSPRAGGVAAAGSYSMPPEELINLAYPEFSGLLQQYWGRNGIHFHSEYLGVPVLMLAVAAMVGRRTRETWFWVITSAVAMLWALGTNTPFYQLVNLLIPGTKYFRAPSTMLFIVGLGVAVLAAYGTERVLARQMTLRYLVGCIVATASVAILTTAGGMRGLAESLAGEQGFALVQQAAPAMIAGSWRALLAALLVAGAVLAFTRRRIGSMQLAVALLLVVGADLWSIERLYWQTTPSAAADYASDPTIEYLNKLEQPARVLATAIGPDAAWHDAELQGDALMTHRIRMVAGYHGNELGNYHKLLDATGSIVNPNFWRLANMQYVLTNVDSLPVAGSTRVAGPARDAAGSPVSLFRLPGEQPFAWVVPTVVKASDNDALSALLDARRFDVRTAALLDSNFAFTPQGVPTLQPPLAITVTVTRYAPGNIDLELSSPAPQGSALVASENFYPGWKALVDGKVAVLGRVDVALIGVLMPSGARRVQLRFASPAVHYGLIVTLVALIAATLSTGLGLASERRYRNAAGHSRQSPVTP